MTSNSNWFNQLSSHQMVWTNLVHIKLAQTNWVDLKSNMEPLGSHQFGSDQLGSHQLGSNKLGATWFRSHCLRPTWFRSNWLGPTGFTSHWLRPIGTNLVHTLSSLFGEFHYCSCKGLVVFEVWGNESFGCSKFINDHSTSSSPSKEMNGFYGCNTLPLFPRPWVITSFL